MKPGEDVECTLKPLEEGKLASISFSKVGDRIARNLQESAKHHGIRGQCLADVPSNCK